MTFLLAGYDTTANSLSFTLYLLATHPEAQQAAASECAAANLASINTLEELQSAIPYTYACFNESMRIFPPGFVAARWSDADVEVGRYRIPRGTSVLINIIGMHHNENYFPQPDQFRPERFMAGNPENDARPEHAFLPFGLGPRACIGARFAVLSALLCLVALLRRVEFELDSARVGQELQIKSILTLGPKHGIPLKVKGRKVSA